MIVTKLDVLDDVTTLKICTGYRLHDTAIDYLPSVVTVLNQVEPVYEDWEGWMQPTTDCRTFEDLPPAARRSLHGFEEIVVGATIALISVGPERDQIIERTPVF